MMNLVTLDKLPRLMVTEFFITHWGSPEMVLSSGIYPCDELDGFAILEDDGAIAGLLIYVWDGADCEVISLDSLKEKKGIGTHLLQAAEERARQAGCRRMKLITTNDNLHALGFYQKRGYQLAALYVNAVTRARERKPSIPLVADNGIPIRDEFLLVKELL